MIRNCSNSIQNIFQFELKLTPISRARSDPSKSMMLQGSAFLLYFPGIFLPVTFWSALPLTFRRLKNRSIFAADFVTPPHYNSEIFLFTWWPLIQPKYSFLSHRHFTFLLNQTTIVTSWEKITSSQHWSSTCGFSFLNPTRTISQKFDTLFKTFITIYEVKIIWINRCN